MVYEPVQNPVDTSNFATHHIHVYNLASLWFNLYAVYLKTGLQRGTYFV